MSASMSYRRRKQRVPVLPVLSITMIIAAIVLFIFELVNFSQGEDRLAAGMSVAGVDVGGLTQAEAEVKWESVYANPVLLYYGDNPIELVPNAIDFRTDSETMLAQSLSSGAYTGDFWIRFFNHLLGREIIQSAGAVELVATYQEPLLRQFLNDIAVRYDRPPGRPSYDVFTMSVYAGDLGSTLNVDQAVAMIDSALRSPDERTVQLPIGDSAASRPSLATLRQLIVDYLDNQGFIYDGQSTVASIFIMDLQTGEELNILSDVAFSAASTIKLPIMIDFYRTLSQSPTRDEAFIMANSLLCSLNASSNTMMRLISGVNDVLTGARSVTDTAQRLGARNTFISAALFESADQVLGSTTAPTTAPNPDYNTEPDPFNQTTSEDLGTLFSLIYDCANFGSGLITAFPNGSFTQQECLQMLELTSANDLQRLLQGGLPSGVRISHKNGWVGDVAGEVGIVYPPNGRDYVIAVFLWERTEDNFQNYEQLWPLIEGISRATWNYFQPDQALISPRIDLPATAQECLGNYLPPYDQINLDDINAWRR